MREYRSLLKYTDFASSNIAVVTTGFTQIGERVISAGIYEMFGYGFSTSQSDADGRIFAKFHDGTNEVSGILRLAIYTPDDQPISGGSVLWESRTEALNSSATDRTKQIPFPKIPIAAGEDYRLKLFFKADAAATIDYDHANTVMLMDITKRSKTA